MYHLIGDREILGLRKNEGFSRYLEGFFISFVILLLFCCLDFGMFEIQQTMGPLEWYASYFSLRYLLNKGNYHHLKKLLIVE